MGLFSIFKRKRITRQPGFRSYQNLRKNRRKPVEPKKVQRSGHNGNGRFSSKRLGRTERRQWRLWRILKLILILAGIFAFIYVLFFTRAFEIRKIDLRGDESTLEEQGAVNEYLQLALGKNMLLFNTAKHEDLLLEQYPYLKDLRIGRRPLHTLIVTLQTYDHVTNIQMEYENGTERFYIVNELGAIAGIGLTDDTLPTIVMDVTGTDLDLAESDEVQDAQPSINQEIIDQEVMETLLKAKEDFEAKFNMQIFEMQYLKRARELHFLTERYFYVWIDLTQPVGTQLTKLKKAMTELNIYEAPLEYVDLRISGQNGEKVIYKLSDGAQ